MNKNTTPPVIDLQNVNVTLGKDFVALDSISVQLPAGKIIGVIGPSGAGKTTLIRSVVGRQKIASGSIKVLGLPAGNKALRHTTSYMTQTASAYGDLTVAQNLAYFAVMVGIARRAIAAEVSRLVKIVDLTAQQHQRVDKLSGGQKQRVSLAIALIGKPKLMVLDEPTVGLDPVLREELWDLFHRLSNQGTTLLISSHVMDEAERCDDLLLIRNGTLLAHGSPKRLCEQTQTGSVQESFLKLVGNDI